MGRPEGDGNGGHEKGFRPVSRPRPPLFESLVATRAHATNTAPDCSGQVRSGQVRSGPVWSGQ
eukprot:3185252-Lingulodinium_polyedra.AAC.1